MEVQLSQLPMVYEEASDLVLKRKDKKSSLIVQKVKEKSFLQRIRDSSLYHNILQYFNVANHSIRL